MIKERDENGRIPQLWTVEKAIAESRKYKTRKDFRSGSNSAYQYLVRHKKLDSICLDGKRNRLSDWDIICSIRFCNSWREFRELRPKEYSAFHKRKDRFHADVYANLGVSKTALRWTKEEVLKEALNYKTRSEFSSKSSGAYDSAQKLGILNEACSHMKSLTSDFDCVYVWTAKKTKHKRVVKVGVTSVRLGLTRINFVEKKSGFKATEIVMCECDEATIVEIELKGIGKKYDVGVFSGSTEFLEVSNFEYKKILEILNDKAKK